MLQSLNDDNKFLHPSWRSSVKNVLKPTRKDVIQLCLFSIYSINVEQ